MKIIHMGFISVPILKRYNDKLLFVLVNTDTDEWIASGFYDLEIIHNTISFLKEDYDTNKHMFNIGKLYKKVLDFKRCNRECGILVNLTPQLNVRWTAKRLNKMKISFEERNN